MTTDKQNQANQNGVRGSSGGEFGRGVRGEFGGSSGGVRGGVRGQSPNSAVGTIQARSASVREAPGNRHPYRDRFPVSPSPVFSTEPPLASPPPLKLHNSSFSVLRSRKITPFKSIR